MGESAAELVNTDIFSLVHLSFGDDDFSVAGVGQLDTSNSEDASVWQFEARYIFHLFLYSGTNVIDVLSCDVTLIISLCLVWHHCI